MTRRTKWSLGALLVAAIVAIVALAAAKRGNSAVAVRMEAVQRRDLVASITASGQVQPRTKVDLSADITGRIVRLAVKEGDIVKKGQFLLEIDPSQYAAAVQRQEAQLAAARADLARTTANLAQARSALERSQAIRQSNATLVSDEQMEQLRTTVDVNSALEQAARYTVAQMQAALRDARSQLSKTTIVAPMSGRVTRLNVEQGETAIMGTLNKDAATLLTISDMSALETIIKVDETDVARISVGDSAVVEMDAFPDTTFVGRVVEIASSSLQQAPAGGSTDQAVDYEVRVQLLNPPPDTRPDFSATAKVITATRRDVVAAPILALTVRENETATNTDSAQVALGKRPARQVGQRDAEGVFVVGADNKVVFRPVTTGIAGEDFYEITSGLRPGERIVAGPYQAVKDLREGAAVREMPAESPATTAKATT